MPAAPEAVAAFLAHEAERNNAGSSPKLESNGSPASHAKYLLAGLELLQTARRDSRDWLLKQLKGV